MQTHQQGDKGCFKDFLYHEDEELTVKEIIEESSNVGTIKIVDLSNLKDVEEFLTRFGFGSTVVVTGDITQIDLPKDTTSGLMHSLEVLKGLKIITGRLKAL